MKVHFLGIGGSGASAVASIAPGYGFEITGCDKHLDNEFVRNFDPKILFEGHSPDHLKDTDILAVTPAVFSLDPENEEIKSAKDRGIEVLTWQEFMGKYLERGKFVIAISGTHGKSTTTAMIGLMLEYAGLDPTVELGAIVPRWGKNFRVGKSKYFVTEADEFNDNFLVSRPDIAVVTSIEFDHPEYFKNLDAYKQSFCEFLMQSKENIVANLQDHGVIEVLASKGDPFRAKVIDYSKQLIDFPLKVPGDFNIYNASAAYQVGKLLGIDEENIKHSLMNYSGIGRRFEHIGIFNGVEVYSDFGHHPTEVKVNIDAARKLFPDKNLVVIFQPHMFSRTKALFDDFVNVFKEAPVNQIIITDIYHSREVDTGLINSQQLVEAINQDRVIYQPKAGLVDFMKQHTKSGDLIFFIGAGDIDKLVRELVDEQ